jgi:bifunctional DNase/RNase
MKNFMMAFNIDLHEIIINDLQEGIFYSKLICSSDKDTIEIDSRTSDAVALAVRFGCPIYTYDNILDSAGILMDEDEKKKKVVVTHTDDKSDDLKKMTIPELESMLNDVLEHEDYIKAASIRDEINRRKGN